jgi:hypothetical protein
MKTIKRLISVYPNSYKKLVFQRQGTDGLKIEISEIDEELAGIVVDFKELLLKLQEVKNEN